jgi:hypothetical protein
MGLDMGRFAEWRGVPHPISHVLEYGDGFHGIYIVYGK